MSEATEKRYTLHEAAAELRRQECAHHGHSWDVLTTTSGPTAILCSNCGKSYAVERHDD